VAFRLSPPGPHRPNFADQGPLDAHTSLRLALSRRGPNALSPVASLPSPRRVQRRASHFWSRCERPHVLQAVLSSTSSAHYGRLAFLAGAVLQSSLVSAGRAWSVVHDHQPFPSICRFAVLTQPWRDGCNSNLHLCLADTADC
jgi:hypothetical protein